MSNDFGEGYGSIKDQESSKDRGGQGGTSGYQTQDNEEFQTLSDSISSNIFQINSNVQAIERICKQLGAQLKEVPHEKLHRIQQGTNKLATETTLCYKRMVNLSRGSESEKRYQRLQQERLKDEFEDSISRYRNVQKKLAEKSREIMNIAATVKFTSHHEDSDKARLLDDDGQQQQEQEQLEDSASHEQITLLEERERMVRQLEADVLDVNEIFRDLAVMVQEQGEVVDSIEGHVFAAHDNVYNANEQLQKASVYRKKARKKKCCILLILLIILIVIGVIIYIKTK